MQTLRILLVVIALAGLARAEQFSLKHEPSGRTFGPFDAEPGSKVVIGSSTFTVVRVEGRVPAPAASAPASGPLLTALAGVKIPQFEVRNAHPDDCVQFVLHTIRNEGGPAGDVNIVTRDIPGVFSPGAKGVNCSLRNVTAYQVLHEVCRQAGLAMTEEAGIVVLQPPK